MGVLRAGGQCLAMGGRSGTKREALLGGDRILQQFYRSGRADTNYQPAPSSTGSIGCLICQAGDGDGPTVEVLVPKFASVVAVDAFEVEGLIRCDGLHLLQGSVLAMVSISVHPGSFSSQLSARIATRFLIAFSLRGGRHFIGPSTLWVASQRSKWWRVSFSGSIRGCFEGCL